MFCLIHEQGYPDKNNQKSYIPQKSRGNYIMWHNRNHRKRCIFVGKNHIKNKTR